MMFRLIKKSNSQRHQLLSGQRTNHRPILTKQQLKTLIRTKNEPSTDTHKATAKTSSPTEKKGAGVIKAPLPGTIIKILVNVGDYVKPGAKLLVWEAMKMENNLTADREGTIKSIKVKPGDTILEGDTLIEIE